MLPLSRNDKSLKMQCFFLPGFSTARCITYKSSWNIPLKEKNIDSETLVKRTKRSILTTMHVSKALRKCHVFDEIIPQKINNYSSQFSDPFNVSQISRFTLRQRTKPEVMRKLKFFTMDCSKKYDDFISVFIISNLQWCSDNTKVPCTLLKLPLHCETDI